MELLTPAIQSYQKHQNLNGAAELSETVGLEATADAKASFEDDEVKLSDQYRVYDWIAQELPQATTSPELIGRASQIFYEYQVFDLRDLNTVNSLLTSSPDNELLDTIQQTLAETTSYTDQQRLNHLNRVFSTLKAAETTSAA